MAEQKKKRVLSTETSMENHTRKKSKEKEKQEGWEQELNSRLKLFTPKHAFMT